MFCKITFGLYVHITVQSSGFGAIDIVPFLRYSTALLLFIFARVYSLTYIMLPTIQINNFGFLLYDYIYIIYIEEHTNKTTLNWIKVTWGIKEIHWLGEYVRIVFYFYSSTFLMKKFVKKYVVLILSDK